MKNKLNAKFRKRLERKLGDTDEEKIKSLKTNMTSTEYYNKHKSDFAGNFDRVREYQSISLQERKLRRKLKDKSVAPDSMDLGLETGLGFDYMLPEIQMSYIYGTRKKKNYLPQSSQKNYFRRHFNRFHSKLVHDDNG